MVNVAMVMNNKGKCMGGFQSMLWLGVLSGFVLSISGLVDCWNDDQHRLYLELRDVAFHFFFVTCTFQFNTFSF